MPITLLVSTPLPGAQGDRLVTTVRSRLNDAMTASGVVFTENAPLTIKVSIDRYGFGPMSEGWRCVTLRSRVVRGGHDFAAIDETAERCLAQPGPTTNGSAWSGSDADLETALDIVKDPEGAAALQLAFEAALEELLNQLDR